MQPSARNWSFEAGGRRQEAEGKRQKERGRRKEEEGRSQKKEGARRSIFTNMRCSRLLFEQPQAIFIDIIIPYLTEFEVLEGFKCDRTTCQIPAIVMKNIIPMRRETISGIVAVENRSPMLRT
ncbi:hypothetical protein [Microcoleus sp. T2B6]|uniref:hypothetical protein n=2 Tax=unclassified Microcoleus TaxID=2642155 RepID=UPI002FD41F12